MPVIVCLLMFTVQVGPAVEMRPTVSRPVAFGVPPAKIEAKMPGIVPPPPDLVRKLPPGPSPPLTKPDLNPAKSQVLFPSQPLPTEAKGRLFRADYNGVGDATVVFAMYGQNGKLQPKQTLVVSNSVSVCKRYEDGKAVTRFEPVSLGLRSKLFAKIKPDEGLLVKLHGSGHEIKLEIAIAYQPIITANLLRVEKVDGIEFVYLPNKK